MHIPIQVAALQESWPDSEDVAVAAVVWLTGLHHRSSQTGILPDEQAALLAERSVLPGYFADH